MEKKRSTCPISQEAHGLVGKNDKKANKYKIIKCYKRGIGSIGC